MNVHGGTYAVEALQFQSVYRVHVHYSDKNVSSLTCTTVPEILYYNRPGVTIDLRCVECNVWMWIHNILHEVLYLYKVCHGTFVILHFARVYNL